MLYVVAPYYSAIFRSTKLIQRTGKSSLINALLHTEGLALTDVSGKAVTAFPTEYRYREEHQEAKFVIKAECFTDSELDDHIQELLDEYRQPYMASAKELSEVEYKMAEDKSHAAKQVFETVFGNTEMFFHDTGDHYSDLDLESMKDQSEGAYDRILPQLQHLSRTLKWPEDMADGLWEDKSATAVRVSELPQPWIDSGLWVFVKIARDASMTNAVCVVLSLDLLAFTSNPIFSRLELSLLIYQDHGDMKDLEKHVSKDLLDKVKDQQNQLSNNRDKLSVSEWMKACAEVKIKYNTLLFSSRNERVETQFKDRYAADFKEYIPALFCVDNRDYHTCRNEQEAILSGIPKLRMFCYERPAKAQFKSAHHYIWTELPSLISSIKIWVQAARSPVKQNLASAESLFNDFDKIETAWREVIENAFGGMLSNCGVLILSSNCLLRILIFPDENLQEIIERAVTTCECQGKMHHCASFYTFGHLKSLQRIASYRAFIRKNGTHQTKTVGKRNWNRELNEDANIVLADDWKSLDEQIATGIQWYLKRVKESMDKIIASAIDTMAPQEFIRNMRGRQTRLHFKLDIEFGEFRMDLGATKRNATAGDEASHFMQSSLWQAVDQMMSLGAGVIARNRERILEHVTSGLFDELFRKINTNLGELALKHLNSIATIRAEISDAIDADISVMTAPDTAVFEKHPEFGQKVVRMLSTAKKSLELLQNAAARPVAWAHQRGYIQDV
ncbi:hypothetical protein EPUS_06941 [Endocarpon pusillum Z07020]|uniref:DUF7605 domain-containing protein n=1 Tax=Endocarpon pusillum (strain Z07020 / HMAS-L-300199) TaxID=1263415 RepID=U1HH32_ENDPU|nr:uncharacterized protein EPUS_06941 [Endocarpon pusillum Z07020]ERF68129.1 hypothetical protein EPUS_06941 [Endocarpon pusillum Z07020]